MLLWSNHEAGRHVGESYARAALSGESIDVVEDCDEAGWCRVRARPLGDARVMVTFEDVTVEHERERALAASERLNASIVENLQEALIVIDLPARSRARTSPPRRCAASRSASSSAAGCATCRSRCAAVTARRFDYGRSPVRRALAGETVRGMLIQVVRARQLLAVGRGQREPARGSGRAAVRRAQHLRRRDRPRGAREADPRRGRDRRPHRPGQPPRAAAHAPGRARARPRAQPHRRRADARPRRLQGGQRPLRARDRRRRAARGRRAAAQQRARARHGRARRRRRVRGRAPRPRRGRRPPAPPSASRPRSRRRWSSTACRRACDAAVGVACFPDDGDDADVLLAAADRAMYARKSR